MGRKAMMISPRRAAAMDPAALQGADLTGQLDLPDALKTTPRRSVSDENKGPDTSLVDSLICAAGAGDVITVERCLEKKADINSLTWGDCTALMAAARHGRVLVLELLWAKNADLNLNDRYHRTAVDHAFRKQQVKSWLLARGGQSGQALRLEKERLEKEVVRRHLE